MARSYFDPGRYKWREVTGGPELSYKVRHDYTILGYDLAAGTLDMVVRWAGDGGHCPIHRHTATTTVLVLDLDRPGEVTVQRVVHVDADAAV